MSLKVKRIDSTGNESLKRLLKSERELFFFEGEKIAKDIVADGVRTKFLISNVKKELPFDLKKVETEELWLVSRAILKKISSLKDTPDLIAVVEYIPEPALFTSETVAVALDNIQDPGNMGTLFRCAAAFGIKDLLLSGHCVSLNNRKFLRAAQNSIFSIRVSRFDTLDSLVKKVENRGFNIYMTSPHVRGVVEKAEKIKIPAIVVIGSEGQGIDENILKSFKKIAIEQSGNVESLNAGISGCIIMNDLKNLFRLLDRS